MPYDFTVEFSDKEMRTIKRVAAVTGQTTIEIVQGLHRTRLTVISCLCLTPPPNASYNLSDRPRFAKFLNVMTTHGSVTNIDNSQFN